MSLIACSRSTTSNAAARENNDFLEKRATISAVSIQQQCMAGLFRSLPSANGRQVMNTTSGQGFTFDATMLPIEKSKLQVIVKAGMKYKFDSFPTAAVKARFTGLGDGLITEMKSEVEVAVARYSQPAGGDAIHFTAADIGADSAYVELRECLFERTIANASLFACFSAAFRREAAQLSHSARRRKLGF